jgi:DNA polymerase-3 subunit alpha
VFQLESQGMRDTLRKMRCGSIEEITALISLYRPGPMDNIDTFVDCKFGRKPVDTLHPSLEPVLKETYGVIVYQEQVMQIAQVLAGYSLGEADLLRRAMGKKKKEEMDAQKARFVSGASEKGVPASRRTASSSWWPSSPATASTRATPPPTP